MSRRSLIRCGGPAAMMGGALYIATFGMVYLLREPLAEQVRGTLLEDHALINAFQAPVYLLLLLGAAGLYARQRDRFGLAGRVGFYLMVLGFSLGAVGGAVVVVTGLIVGGEAVTGLPNLVIHAFSHVGYSTGSVLLGIATYRAGILPKEPAAMLGAGPAWQLALFLPGVDQSFALLLPPFIVTALGWTWLGYALFSEKEPPEPPPVVVPIVR